MLINSLFPVQVTKNFNTSEVVEASHITKGLAHFFVDQRLFDIAQYLRTRLETPITINSAVRSPEYNKSVGGAPDSQHLEIHGNAFDLSGDGLVDFVSHAYKTKNADWYHLVSLGVNGLGLYNSFVHVDVRPNTFAFWNKQVSVFNPLYIIFAVIVGISYYLKTIFQ